MPRRTQRDSLLTTRVSESAKWRRENAKYVKYPKTSSAHGAGQLLLQRESWCTQQRRVWADTHLTMAVLPRHTALTADRFCRGVSPRNPSDSSAKRCSLTEKKKKQIQKCEFGTKWTRGRKRTEAWRRKHAHTQKFCGSGANSTHNAELFCGGRNAAK